MKLLFQCQNELVLLVIDRKKKGLQIASKQTDYKRVAQPWYKLFDKGQEKEQEQKTDKMSDKEFINEINHSFNKIGYKRINLPK